MSVANLEVLGLGVIAAVGCLVAALSFRPAPPSDVELVQTRLRNYAAATGAAAAPATLEELELQAPFAERVIRPQLARLGRLLARATPEQSRQELQRKLNLAGRPYGLEAVEFTVVRYLFTGLMTLVGLGLGRSWSSGPALLLFTVVGGLIGFFLPALWLRQLVNQRRSEIEYSLPNAIDLLSVSVEAGLSFEAALGTVSEKLEGPLAQEFLQVLQEIRLGRPRLEALDDLGRRAGVEEVHNLAQSIIQSAQLGTPISQILTLQADEIRRQRRQKAQEMGARAPLKMLFPMVTCIFPTLWVMLLGPALLLILSQCAGSH